MAIGIGAATLGASLIGGISSFLGAKSQNKANQAIAASQMAFQERMSGTAYQRAVEDMRKAGINPMLAYSKGGATTPGGAGLPMVNELAGVGKAVSSALQMRRLNAEVEQIEATTRKTHYDEELVRNQGNTEAYKRVHLGRQSDMLYAQEQITKLNLSSAYAASIRGMTQAEINKSPLAKWGLWIKQMSPFTSSARDLQRLGGR